MRNKNSASLEIQILETDVIAITKVSIVRVNKRDTIFYLR